jgi:hypothetical protein
MLPPRKKTVPFPKRTKQQHIELHKFLVSKAEVEIEVQKTIIAESEKAIRRLEKELDPQEDREERNR